MKVYLFIVEGLPIYIHGLPIYIHGLPIYIQGLPIYMQGLPIYIGLYLVILVYICVYCLIKFHLAAFDAIPTEVL